jgi:hypothetical protein
VTARLSPRQAGLLFALIMSLLMAAIMSGIITAVNRGLAPGYLLAWGRSFAIAWPIAFPLILVLAPRVRAFVERVARGGASAAPVAQRQAAGLLHGAQHEAGIDVGHAAGVEQVVE